MPSVSIVGGGQAGLQLGLGLLQNDCRVRIVQNRSAEEVRRGRVMSAQCMFNIALEHERALGLNFWEDECPQIDGVRFVATGGEGDRVVDWAGRLDAYAMSVDQRVKFSAWMDAFEARGGEMELRNASVADLERYAREDDLVVVAAGKGDISRIFERDSARSPFDKPMRSLATTYLRGFTSSAGNGIAFTSVPGVGEVFYFPGLTVSGPCHMMTFQGVPGGPMDCWDDAETPEQHLACARRLIERFLPWEAAGAVDAELSDDNARLTGRLVPTVRKPIGRLPSGALVLGMADTVVLNDPIAGQGSNNASKAARVYLEAILSRDGDEFDADWMQKTFDTTWEEARWSTQLSNMLLEPAPDFVLELLASAAQLPELAHRFTNGFDNPRDLFPWLATKSAAEAYLEKLRGELRHRGHHLNGSVITSEGFEAAV